MSAPTQPKISVIIPVYNGAKFLPEAIANVEAQAHPSLEIIVVDDGSTDDTATVAQTLGDRIRYIHQSNQGPAAARNRGLAIARGTFVAFLDVDDQWPAEKLDHQLAAFAANPQLEIVNGYVQMMQAVPRTDRGWGFQPRHAPLVSFNLGSALFRKSVFEKVGHFDASQIHSEDVDWFMHARELGVAMVVLEEVTLLYRKHGENLTGDRSENLKGFLHALHKSIRRRRQQGEATAALPQLNYLDAQGQISQKDSQAPAPLPSQSPRSPMDVNSDAANPLVSVILAVRNGEQYVAEAIDSVLASDYRPLEIVVVDGQSSDRTAEIVQAYSEVNYVLQRDRGLTEAYNLGLTSSRGDFVAFISHDDRWTPHKLSRQMTYLISHPEVQYTVTQFRYFLEHGCSIPKGLNPELLDRDLVGHIMETLVARKTVFEAVGLLNTQYEIAADVDWYARAKDLNIPSEVIPEVLLWKRLHDTNTSSNAQVNTRELLKVLRQSVQRQKR
jgi:glycosyltransferase involved in cell wall biosynthesis